MARGGTSGVSLFLSQLKQLFLNKEKFLERLGSETAGNRAAALASVQMGR